MGYPKKIKGGGYEFSRDDRGFYYLNLLSGPNFTVRDVVEIEKYMDAFHQNEPLPFLIELGYGTILSEKVQAIFAYGSHRRSVADAILISTPAHRTTANHYIRQFRPKTPTRVFSDVFDALEWIGSKSKSSIA